MQDFILSQVDSIRRVSGEAVDAFGKLNHKQLNWKPAEDKWSIAQVFDHIITTDRTYFDLFDEVAEGRHKNSFFESIGFISRFWGRQMIRDLGPAKPKTYKSPPMFQPSESLIKDTIIVDFKNHQKQMRGYFERMDGMPLDKIVITSPAAGFITYSVHDAMLILTGHQQRHLNQAMQVFGNPGFPRVILGPAA